MASMDPSGQRLILHTVDRGEARCAQPAGLTCIDESVSLFLSVAESPPAVGFDDVAVRSSHSRHAMTALLCGCEWFQMALGTTLTFFQLAQWNARGFEKHHSRKSGDAAGTMRAGHGLKLV